MKNLKHTIWTTLILSFICAFFVSCGSATNRNSRILLDSGWSYSMEDPIKDNVTLKPLADGEILELEKVKEIAENGGVGEIFLEKKFIVPSQLQGRDLAVYLGRVTLADETWVNNIFIGKYGRFSPKEFSAWNMARCYSIPAKYLHAGENTLRVKVCVDGEGSLGANMFIGLLDDANAVATRENFWHSKINLLFAFFMIIIAFYHLIIYIRRPVDKENIFFALLNFVSVFYILIYFIYEIPDLPRERANFLLYQKIFSSGLPFFLPFLTTSFVNAFLKRKERKVMLWIRLAFLIIPVLIVLFMPNYPALKKITAPLMTMLIPPMLYIIALLLKHLFQKDWKVVPLILGFSPLVLCFALDLILHNALKLDNVPYFTPMGWQFVIIGLLFIMANRFAASTNEAEYLNTHLEKEVKDRTRELSEANTELEAAKFRADRDMDLAVHVQQSFYVNKAPIVDGWDIAYTFQPMSGVSGDLYDFYTDGRTFKGLGLFDISGHGIASGLVAMLAKVIMDRKFKEGYKEPLNHVMDSINRDMVESKGDIENYMTGVLFRFTGNKVEYINAGHPKVFVRTANDGKVVPIMLPNSDNDNSGGLVGISGLAPSFKVIGFNLRPGDAMLIYTDCLYESRNIEGEEMTQDGVQKMFSNVTGVTANDKLKDVLNQFNSFTKGVPLRDDLTVIVVQKK